MRTIPRNTAQAVLWLPACAAAIIPKQTAFRRFIARLTQTRALCGQRFMTDRLPGWSSTDQRVIPPLSCGCSHPQSVVVAVLLLAVSGCTKVEPNTLLGCRVANGGVGVGGIANPRTIMFWADRTMAGSGLHLVTIRNTETNGAFYGRSSADDMMRYFATEPACGTYGPVTVEVSKGYEYEYTFTCANRQLKGTVTVDCSSDACLPIQLQ